MKQKLLRWLTDFINPSVKIGRLKFIAFMLVNIALGALVLLGAQLGMHFVAIYIGIQLVSISVTNILIKRIFSIGFVRYVVTAFVVIILSAIAIALLKDPTVILIILSAIGVLSLLLVPAKKPNKQEESLEKVKVSYKESFKFIFLNKEGTINRRTYFVTGCLMFELVYIISFIAVLILAFAGVNVMSLSSEMSVLYAIVVLVTCYFIYCYTLKRVNSFNGKKVLAIMLAFVFPVLTLAADIIYAHSLESMNVGYLQASLYALITIYIISIVLGLYVLFKKSKYELTAENFAIYNKIKHLVLVLFLVSNFILVTAIMLAAPMLALV